MISTYINEYLTTLLTNLPENAINNAVGFISSILVYIPLHFILKWLVGEKNARISLFMYAITMVLTLTNILVGA